MEDNAHSDTDARIVALEERLAHQDDAIETLNAAITDQWSRIEALTRQMTELRDRVTVAEAAAPALPGHEPPPHY